MNSLLENPVGIGAIGLAIVGLLALVAMKLGEWKALYAAGAVLAATVSLIVVSVVVLTDREKITGSLYDLASALRANDHEQALSFLHPNAAPAIQRAKQDLASVNFHEARISSIRSIIINESSSPPTATSEFVGFIKATSDHYTGGFPASAPRLFKLYWMRQQDRWLIRDYEHSDVRRALAE